MVYDRKVFRASQDAIGAPGDDAAVNSTDDNTMIALLKGLFELLDGTGITITDVSTAAKQDTGNAALVAILAKILTAPATEAKQDTGNTSLSSIDTKMTTLASHVDGLEALATALNGFVDGLEALAAAATPAGTSLIGRTVADASAATGGISLTARLPSAAGTTNATNVKTSAGRVYQASGKNNAAYDVFLVLYDAVTAPPVPGTTTIRKKMICPAGQAFVYDWPVGLGFTTGIGYAFTKLVADADTTVLVAADITAFNLDYV